jgi:hypothetical protein
MKNGGLSPTTLKELCLANNHMNDLGSGSFSVPEKDTAKAQKL